MHCSRYECVKSGPSNSKSEPYIFDLLQDRCGRWQAIQFGKKRPRGSPTRYGLDNNVCNQNSFLEQIFLIFAEFCQKVVQTLRNQKAQTGCEASQRRAAAKIMEIVAEIVVELESSESWRRSLKDPQNHSKNTAIIILQCNKTTLSNPGWRKRSTTGLAIHRH